MRRESSIVRSAVSQGEGILRVEEDGCKGGSGKLGDHGPFCLLLTMTVWWNNWLEDYEGNDIRQKQSIESILHRGEKYWWGWEVTVYFKTRITYVSD